MICEPHSERGQRVPAVRTVAGTPMCEACFRGCDIGEDPSERLARAARKSWRDRATRERRSLAIRAVLADPERRRQMSERRRREWQDPEIRRRRLEGLKHE